MKNKKEKGFAVMLLSLIFLVGFPLAGWRDVFDLSIRWAHIWIILGIVGFLMAVTDGKMTGSDRRIRQIPIFPAFIPSDI